MNKIRVIDLLNKIANGEEVPKKFRFNGYTYQLTNGKYLDEENDSILSNINYDLSNLNDEVEIIEEQKKIKKLDLDGYYDDNSYCECKSEWCSSEDVLVVKINEIIDEINNLKEK